MKISAFLGPALVWIVCGPVAFAQEKWTGIDESVIERFAEEKGRAATEPFLNVEGDMLLFLFALAGAIGGFIAGYYWHKVFVTGREEKK